MGHAKAPRTARGQSNLCAQCSVASLAAEQEDERAAVETEVAGAVVAPKAAVMVEDATAAVMVGAPSVGHAVADHMVAARWWAMVARCTCLCRLELHQMPRAQ